MTTVMSNYEKKERLFKILTALVLLLWGVAIAFGLYNQPKPQHGLFGLGTIILFFLCLMSVKEFIDEAKRARFSFKMLIEAVCIFGGTAFFVALAWGCFYDFLFRY